MMELSLQHATFRDSRDRDLVLNEVLNASKKIIQSNGPVTESLKKIDPNTPLQPQDWGAKPNQNLESAQKDEDEETFDDRSRQTPIYSYLNKRNELIDEQKLKNVQVRFNQVQKKVKMSRQQLENQVTMNIIETR